MSSNKKLKIDKTILDDALGVMIFGCNLPFSLVDSQLFKNFVYLLDPSYNIPSSKTLKTTVLNRIFEKFSKYLKQENEAKGTLMVDGWKNKSSNSKTVTTMIKPRFAKEIFLKSYDFSMLSENHENILEMMEDSKTIAKQMHNIDLDSVCTDHIIIVTYIFLNSSEI